VHKNQFHSKKVNSTLRCLSDLMGVKVDLVMKTALKPRIGKHRLKEVM
jgi:predicted nucleotidyltransferase